LINSFS